MPYKDAHIAYDLGALNNDIDYAAAKAGDLNAAIAVAGRLVTPAVVEPFRQHDKPIVVGVVSLEATGHNAIPQAAAAVLAGALEAELGVKIVQSNSPKRTSLKGLDRLFGRPEFEGDVEPGRNYILVDDTITQGGTFAALSQHIEKNGGHVVGVLALSGKEYSYKIGLTDETLDELRQRFGDIEDDFEKGTGRRFDAFTESEARYLARFKQADRVRTRVAEEIVAGARHGAAEAPGTEGPGVTPAPAPQVDPGAPVVRTLGGAISALNHLSSLVKGPDSPPASKKPKP